LPVAAGLAMHWRAVAPGEQRVSRRAASRKRWTGQRRSSPRMAPNSAARSAWNVRLTCRRTRPTSNAAH